MNQFINDDCFNVMPDIPDKSIDCIISDMPYNITACHWDKQIIDLDKLWIEYKRIIKDNGAVCLFGSQPFTSKLVMSNIKWFKYDWVWKKPQGVDPFMSKIIPLNNIENISIFCNKKTIYNPQMVIGKSYVITRDKNSRIKETNNAIMKETTTINHGTRLPTRILEFKQQKGLHPVQKPVALYEYLIKTYTNENEIVLDSFAGVATNAIACMNTNRKYICIEQDKEYYDKGMERIKIHKEIK